MTKQDDEKDLNTTAPILSTHIQNGVIWRDEAWGGYIGKAEDGQEVCFGFNIERVELYLKAHPTPDTW